MSYTCVPFFLGGGTLPMQLFAHWLVLNLRDSSQNHHIRETFLINLWSKPFPSQILATLYCITNPRIIFALITICNYYFYLFTYLSSIFPA